MNLPSDPIALVFQQDPLTLPDSAIDRAVEEFRRRRSAFHSEEAVKSLKPKKEKVKLDPGAELLRDRPISEINLEDLD